MSDTDTMQIAVLPGDGVGPEVTSVAIDVLRAAVQPSGYRIETTECPIGYAAVQEADSPLPDATQQACTEANAVFLGAVGDPAGDSLPSDMRPEKGLLGLRKLLGCFANLRPIKAYDSLLSNSPLREESIRGTDCMIVRELAGGLYYGEPRWWDEGTGRAVNTMAYDTDEVSRVARVAFELAGARSGRVTSVDKANVLEVSRLWRHTVDTVAEEYPAVVLDHMLVDRAAMELVLRPSRFDVLLTENLFGDVLSDEGAAVTGSLGVLGSASLGGTTDLYEPVHGSAPDIAGQNVANPVGAIESVAMMLRYTFQLDSEAERVEGAIQKVFADGFRTADLGGIDGGGRVVGTREFGDAVVEAMTRAR